MSTAASGSVLTTPLHALNAELGARMAEYVPLHHVVNGESLSYSSSIQNYFNAVKRGGTAGKVCSSPSPS